MGPWRHIATVMFATTALTPGLAMAQVVATGAPPPIEGWRVAGALLLCLLLALPAALALRHRLRAGPLPGARPTSGPLPSKVSIPKLADLLRPAADRRLRVLETVRISPYADVCLVQIDNRTLLLAATSTGVSVLDDDVKAEAPTS